MSRKPRKVNLKKLQLPRAGTTGENLRVTRSSINNVAMSTQSSLSTSTTETNFKAMLFKDKRRAVQDISKTKTQNNPNRSEANGFEPPTIEEETNSVQIDGEIHNHPPVKIGSNAKYPSCKRTKLSAFVYKVEKNIHTNQNETPTKKAPLNDFKTPAKKVKQASKRKFPATKTAKSGMRRQPSIKSALLRNEQLSSEFAEQQCVADNDKPTMLQKYGFRAIGSEQYNCFATSHFLVPNRRKKNKWANKFTPLIFRDEELQRKKIIANINALFEQEYATHSNETENEVKQYEVISAMLKKYRVPAESCIYKNAKYMPPTTENVDIYFVKDLFEKTHVCAGHLLFDWTAIPGRDQSPTRKINANNAHDQAFQQVYIELEQQFENHPKVSTENLDMLVKDIVPKATKYITENNIEVQSNELAVDICVPAVADSDPKSDHAELANIQRHLVREARRLDEPSNIFSTKIKNTSNTSLNFCGNPATTINILPNEMITDSENCALPMEMEKHSAITSMALRTRVTSPDIFADSDDDIETEKQKTYCTVNAHGVTTYEIYSSDEVKISSVSEQVDRAAVEGTSGTLHDKNCIIDFTQERLKYFDDSINRVFQDKGSKVTNTIALYNEIMTENNKNNRSEICVSRSSARFPCQAMALPDTNLNNQSIFETLEFNQTKRTRSISRTLTPEKHIIILNNIKRCSSFVNRSRKSLNDSTTKMQCNSLASSKTELIGAKCSKSASFSSSLQCHLVGNLNSSSKRSMTSFDLTQDNDDNVQYEKNCCRFFNDDNTFSIMRAKRTNHREITNGTRILTEDLTHSSEVDSEHLITEKKIKSPQKKNSLHGIRQQKLNTSASLFGINRDIDLALDEDFSHPFASVSADVVNDSTKERVEFHNFDSRLKPFIQSSLKSPTKICEYSGHEAETSFQMQLALSSDDENAEYDDNSFILSDDEINYSIMKVNKINYTKMDSNTHIPTEDLTLSSGGGADNLITSSNKKSLTQKLIDYSYMDLIKENDSVNITVNDITISKCRRSAALLSCDGDVVPIVNETLGTPKKWEFSYSLPLLPNHVCSNFSRERAEFGILDTTSEPLTQSPFKTPTKTCEYPEVSFQTVLPSQNSPNLLCKRNRSNQKFNDLLKAVENDADSDEYDDFDVLVYGKPNSKKTTQREEPSGLQQLLTAQLSFVKFDEDTNQRSIKTSSTLKKNGSDTSIRREQQREEFEEIEMNDRIYCVRATSAPKPNYAQQTESELLKQLYTLGIKPLSRKQAIKILEYIYNQTHPIMLEQEDEDGMHTRYESTDLKEAQIRSKSINSIPVVASATCGKFNLQDRFNMSPKCFSGELSADLIDEDYIFPVNITKKTVYPLLPFHIAWFNLVCSNYALYETIVLLEPIDLQEIYLFLKSLGYRYDPKELRCFFDRRCISFRYDLASSESTRHIRKSQKQLRR